MKTLVVSIVSGICVIAALASPELARAQAVQLVFQTTFDCPDWNQTMGLGDAKVCQENDGISGLGGWITRSGTADQITAAANHPGGGGGKGFRHWRGNGADGKNDNGGGLKIVLPSAYSELWIRFYMRYQAGFRWGNDAPHYTKEIYFHEFGNPILGIQGGGSAWGIRVRGRSFPSLLTWEGSQNGALGDGRWHCYEYHIKQDGRNGLVEFWFDGRKYLSQTVDAGSTPMHSFTLGDNQNWVVDANGLAANQNGKPTDYYTDFDDIAISTTGYIGPIGTAKPGLSAPNPPRGTLPLASRDLSFVTVQGRSHQDSNMAGNGHLLQYERSVLRSLHNSFRPLVILLVGPPLQ